MFDIGVTGLLAAVQAASGDLRAAGTGSVLVVNGALGQHDDALDAFSTTVGGDGVAATAATIINAGATNRRVMWQGIGHGASVYSACAMAPLLEYLTSGKTAPTDTYCPA